MTIFFTITTIIQELHSIQNGLLVEDEENIKNTLIMLNKKNVEAEIEEKNLRIIDKL